MYTDQPNSHPFQVSLHFDSRNSLGPPVYHMPLVDATGRTATMPVHPQTGSPHRPRIVRGDRQSSLPRQVLDSLWQPRQITRRSVAMIAESRREQRAELCLFIVDRKSVV